MTITYTRAGDRADFDPDAWARGDSEAALTGEGALVMELGGALFPHVGTETPIHDATALAISAGCDLVGDPDCDTWEPRP